MDSNAAQAITAIVFGIAATIIGIITIYQYHRYRNIGRQHTVQHHQRHDPTIEFHGMRSTVFPAPILPKVCSHVSLWKICSLLWSSAELESGTNNDLVSASMTYNDDSAATAAINEQPPPYDLATEEHAPSFVQLPRIEEVV